jgi:hypothetical protein
MPDNCFRINSIFGEYFPENVQEAKFQKVLVPISKMVLDPAQRADIFFNAFFTHILAHELMHGLGPHNIQVGGADSTVRLHSELPCRNTWKARRSLRLETGNGDSDDVADQMGLKSEASVPLSRSNSTCR